MRRAAIGLTLGSLIFCGMAFSMQATPDAANLPVLSVTRRLDYAFALATDGLYRAPLGTKKWEKLKTPAEMPLDGKFASVPDNSPLVLYVALKSMFVPKDKPSPPGLRYGIYLSRDHGMSWELASERDNYGATLLLPDGALFAVAGADGANAGNQILKSTDLGKTWRDITGNAFGQFQSIDPDPDHPGLVLVRAWGIRGYVLTAKNEKYEWNAVHEFGYRPRNVTKEQFFARDSSSTNRFHIYSATLSNYFGYDFGNQVSAQALEIAPLKPRFEFAKGAKVVVPIKVVFHWDQDSMAAQWRKAEAEGRPFPKPSPPSEKLAVQPDGMDFWGVRVQMAEVQTVKFPMDRGVITITSESTPDGQIKSTRSQPEPAKYQVFNLSPSTPYEHVIDLGTLANFSKSGEYSVQIIYNSGGSPDRDAGVWNGSFTSPVFTVIVGR